MTFLTVIDSILLITIGAGCGATLRWILSIFLNSKVKFIDLGTLAANYLGCLIMGVVMGVFATYHISASIHLMLATGFLGALTTFSSFSGEVITRFLSKKWLNATFVICAHMGGCLLSIVIGLALWHLI